MIAWNAKKNEINEYIVKLSLHFTTVPFQKSLLFVQQLKKWTRFNFLAFDIRNNSFIHNRLTKTSQWHLKYPPLEEKYYTAIALDLIQCLDFQLRKLMNWGVSYITDFPSHISMMEYCLSRACIFSPCKDVDR